MIVEEVYILSDRKKVKQQRRRWVQERGARSNHQPGEGEVGMSFWGVLGTVTLRTLSGASRPSRKKGR